jgi:catechol 2,3-dioxygenase-like lactoylglutathione lyase family enzyme
MIIGLDRVTLRIADVGLAAERYAMLLAQPPYSEQGRPVFRLANAGLELIEKRADAEEGLAGLTLAVRDLGKARRLLERRGMRVHLAGADRYGAGRLHIATDSTHGMPISLVERGSEDASAGTASAGAADAAVSGVDHIVIRTPNPERAVALYAGRLGLGLRLDRSEPSWGARLLFFRCGDLVIEAVHDLKAAIGDEPDELWGLSWRVSNIAAAHARLKTAGVAVSDIRNGRRPGSKVFTVSSHTAGVPTLMIALDA